MISIYTDGGCTGNPGPGGWAFVILKSEGSGAKGTVLAEISGAEQATTNNRMELQAAIEGLEYLKGLEPQPKAATVWSDSQYLQKGMTEWIFKWKKKNWRSSAHEPVRNQELWLRLDELAAEFQVTWKWVKGHSGNPWNERCDALTRDAIQSLSAL